jgi:hypothetical protein
MVATFVAVGILHWPLLAVVAVLAPASIAAAWLMPAAPGPTATGVGSTGTADHA